MLENIGHCGNGSYVKAVVIKHAKQTTGKSEENVASPKANICRWINRIRTSCVYGIKDNEMSVLCNIITQ
jgi:hypothetical protein